MLENVILTEQPFCLDDMAKDLSRQVDIEPIISSPNKFYFSPAHLRLLQSLDAFSNGNKTLGVLIGAMGSGKTTFLEYFKNEKKLDSIYYIQGHAKMTLAAFWSEFSLIVKNYEQNQTQDTTRSEDPFVLIDDADCLAFEILTAIVCFVCEQMQTKVRILLAGEIMLQKRLAAINEKDNFLYVSQEFFLDPLTFTEVKSYLMTALYDITHSESKLLSSETQQKIYKLSEGYPGRINRITHQILMDARHEVKLARQKKNIFDKCLRLAIFFLVIAIVFQVFNIYFHPFLQSSPTPIKKHASVWGIKKQIKVVSLIPKEIVPLSYIASIENMPIEEVIPPEVPVQSIPMQPIEKKLLPSVAKHQQQTALGPVMKGYTLQLLASPEKSNLPQWLNTAALHDQIHTFHIHRGDKSWFVVTFGNFSSKEKAQVALTHLPAQIKERQPWVRSLSVIRTMLFQKNVED